MAAFQGGPGQVGVHRAGPAPVNEPFVDQFVSGNYFSMFGLRAFAGRLIEPADDTRGAPPVAVMSYRAWRQQYGADPSVIGATFIIDGYPFTIAGIAPPGFFGDTMRPDPPDFWLPLAAETTVHQKNALLDRKNDYWVYAFGRLRPGASIPAVAGSTWMKRGCWPTIRRSTCRSASPRSPTHYIVPAAPVYSACRIATAAT